MIIINPFKESGQWYKGGLHCHSNISDGRLSPEELIEHYKDNGWDFLSITDHQVFFNSNKLNQDNFIVIPGIEHGIKSPSDRIIHLVGLCSNDNNSNKNPEHGKTLDRFEWTDLQNVQANIDILKENNCHVIFCHPVWSKNSCEDLHNLKNYFAVEVYNHHTEVTKHMGLATTHWDSILMSGRKIWGIAVDDCHFKANTNDKGCCGGWVMVKAKSLTANDIMDSLLSGRFYSSTGPEIYNLEVVDDTVYVDCSPVNAIHFMVDNPRGSSYRADTGKTLSSAKHTLKGIENYVRVECIDIYGKTAWSNPIYLKD